MVAQLRSEYGEETLAIWPSYWRLILCYLNSNLFKGSLRTLIEEMASHISEPFQEYVNTLVLNRYKDSTKDLPLPLVNIMRPGPYGNPYSHQSGARIAPQFQTSTREAAVLSYLLELRLAKPEFISELKGKFLLCCCAPSLCHGHMLAILANSTADTYSYQERIDKWLTDSILTLFGRGLTYLNKSFLERLEQDYSRSNIHWKDPMFAFKIG